MDDVVAPAEVGMSAAGLDAALCAYQRCAEAEDLPGGVLVVASKGRCCFLRAFGTSDTESGVALQTDAIFRAASMTKITTCLAAMMLADRGQLLLDDPVSKFLPAFRAMSRVTGGGSAAAAATTPCTTQMTVRHLMSHTSGLTYGFFGGTGACGVVDELARAQPRVGARVDSDEGEVE
jgi:CubicO group peptidase (beta-lactamase class C family)